MKTYQEFLNESITFSSPTEFPITLAYVVERGKYIFFGDIKNESGDIGKLILSKKGENFINKKMKDVPKKDSDRLSFIKKLVNDNWNFLFGQFTLESSISKKTRSFFERRKKEKSNVLKNI